MKGGASDGEVGLVLVALLPLTRALDHTRKVTH